MLVARAFSGAVQQGFLAGVEINVGMFTRREQFISKCLENGRFGEARGIYFIPLHDVRIYAFVDSRRTIIRRQRKQSTNSYGTYLMLSEHKPWAHSNIE